MKYILILIPIVILAASGCNNSNNKSSDRFDSAKAMVMTDTTTNTLHDTPAIAKPDNGGVVHDTILWVGVTARWIKSQDFAYDGTYDSTNYIFMPCGQESTVKVPKENIDFSITSNCDTSFGSRVKLMYMIKGDTVPPVVLPFTVVSAGQVNDNTMVHFNNGTQMILIRPQEAVRVRQAAAVHRATYMRREVLRH
jgi:hypothetical protein